VGVSFNKYVGAILKFIFLSFVLFLVGCSMTLSPSSELAKNKYQIKTFGNSFSKRDDLERGFIEKAEKLCSPYKFEVESQTYYRQDAQPIINGQVVTLNADEIVGIVVCQSGVN
jgi:hypothetical protein